MIGYENQTIDRIIEAMQVHPNTILVDVRRYSFSQISHEFNRKNLKQQFGEHYISDRYLRSFIEKRWLVSGV
jgi:uncharacterized protein (DUF488 family)